MPTSYDATIGVVSLLKVPHKSKIWRIGFSFVFRNNNGEISNMPLLYYKILLQLLLFNAQELYFRGCAVQPQQGLSVTKLGIVNISIAVCPPGLLIGKRLCLVIECRLFHE